MPTSSSEGFSGANVTRKTTEGLDVISLSGAGFPDSINNNVAVYASNAFPTNRTQLAGPVSVTTASGRSASVTFESGMMAGQIAENLSTGLSSLGISATASNLVELSGIANGLVEFELVGNNLSTVQISTTVSNGSHAGLISQINSFSDTTGVKAYSSGNSGVILEHVDAGDIALKTLNLGSGVGISVNQLDRFGDRMLTNSKTLSDGQHLVIGGNVQMKSTSDFTASYNGNNLNSNDIINSLSGSPKKILGTIAEMENKDLISFKNGDIKLNESGMDYALRIIRVHRLWEKYLSEKTGFDKKDWHEIAEKMEHKLDFASDTTPE